METSAVESCMGQVSDSEQKCPSPEYLLLLLRKYKACTLCEQCRACSFSLRLPVPDVTGQPDL